jgi:hypothetical protein
LLSLPKLDGSTQKSKWAKALIDGDFVSTITVGQDAVVIVGDLVSARAVGAGMTGGAKARSTGIGIGGDPVIEATVRVRSSQCWAQVVRPESRTSCSKRPLPRELVRKIGRLAVRPNFGVWGI